MKLEQFLKENQSDLLTNLTEIVADLKATMASDPKEYTEYGSDDPSIDVRLCIDLGDGHYGWIFRTGLSDYDPYHSEYCAAASIGLDTNPEKLLAELINQLGE